VLRESAAHPQRDVDAVCVRGRHTHGQPRGETDALRHLNAYFYGAPILAAAFLVPLFPWSTSVRHPQQANTDCTTSLRWTARPVRTAPADGSAPQNTTLQGLHYVFSLCFWDAAMSYVGVSHSALGTDISGHLVVRTRCKKCGRHLPGAAP